VVPVIRQAEELTLAELSARAAELADQARSGKLAPDEMTGSTFTISNMGMLDLDNFTAIINPGEAAILAVASAFKNKPLPRDTIIFGEVGLGGEVRATGQVEKRINEAEKIGFKEVVAPNFKQPVQNRIKITKIKNIADAIKYLGLNGKNIEEKDVEA
jgi:hypothetical protein